MATDDRLREHESMVRPRQVLEAYAPELGPKTQQEADQYRVVGTELQAMAHEMRMNRLDLSRTETQVSQVDFPDWKIANSFTCDSQTRTPSHHHYLTQGATR